MKPATDDELLKAWGTYNLHSFARRAIYDLGVKHGRQQAAEDRPLWPEPITDRPPTKADAGEDRLVMAVNASGIWHARPWESAAECEMPWQHMPGWRPKPPTLNQLALADLEANSTAYPGLRWDNIRRALEAQS